jgi:hypothetical protein
VNAERMHFVAMWVLVLIKLKLATESGQGLTLDAEEAKAMLEGVRLGYSPRDKS